MTNLKLLIPHELFAPAESSHFEGNWELPVFKSGPDLYSFAAPLVWSVDVSNVGDALLLEGVVEGVAATSCGRCLEPVSVKVIGDVEGYFLIKEGNAPDDMEGDEFDILPEDNEIDLEPLLQQALLLALPLVPLCNEDCLGLCLKCGANLNTDPCECDDGEEIELADGNPFAVLLDIDFEEE